jgi:hypothetical protein
MNDASASFAWPSALTLILRAEQALQITRPSSRPVAAPVPMRRPVDLGALEVHLVEFERTYHALVPPGFASHGRLAAAKSVVKRATRKFVWWYVEPRWDVQRQATADLAAFLHSSIGVLREVSVEVEELQARVDAMERIQSPL